MYLLPALLVGLAGSLHCAGMCGPLVLAAAGLARQGGGQWWWPQLLYHTGRVGVYAMLGALAGGLGYLLPGGQVAQQWLSIGAGVAMLVALLLAWLGQRLSRFSPANWSVYTWAVRRVGKMPAALSMPLLGAANGLLPCGLVYYALLGAVAAGDWLAGAGYMLVFGLGTWPVLLAVGWLGRRIPITRANTWMRLGILLAAVLLVLRGLGLGIPYLSPALHTQQTELPAGADCH